MTDPIPTARDDRRAPGVRTPTDTELLSTLFELGREVTSVLDLEELLAKIPQLIARLTRFSAFSVYLLDEKRKELRIAYAVGSPATRLRTCGSRSGKGSSAQRWRKASDPRQRHPARARYSRLLAQHALAARRSAAPQGHGHRRTQLLNEAEGALRRRTKRFCVSSRRTVRVAIENAALRVRAAAHRYVEALAEIGREMSSILDLERCSHGRQPHEAPR